MKLRNIKNYNFYIRVRGTPYSKYNIQYNKEIIKYTLISIGFTYIYMAKEVATKRESKVSYNKEGYADFEKVVNEVDFKRGIKRLHTGINNGYNYA